MSSDSESCADLPWPPPPTMKRLTPIGANSEEDDHQAQAYRAEADQHRELTTNEEVKDFDSNQLRRRLDEMERDQEELNNSLMSMTSHFAKVQLRLQQVVSAPSERREELLKELEHFAFRGIPRVVTSASLTLSEDSKQDEQQQQQHPEEEQPPEQQQSEASSSAELDPQREYHPALESQREKQAELIRQLKGQLEELESYAYESGEDIVPSSMLLERQKTVMEQLKHRLNLNVDDLVKLSEAEVKAEVDTAVGQIVAPLKMKSHLVNQLMTQITDLENFIDFLQSDAPPRPAAGDQGCGCSKHAISATGAGGGASLSLKQRIARYNQGSTITDHEIIRTETKGILEKTMAVLQLATFGCGSEQRFAKNTLKRNQKIKHFGDLRAQLELAVDHLLEACSQTEALADEEVPHPLSSEEEEAQPEYLTTSPRVTLIARKEVGLAVRDLMQHGLIQSGYQGQSLISLLGCSRSSRVSRAKGSNGNSSSHAWDLIMHYYNLKQGPSFNSQPQHRLSQSFGLDLAGFRIRISDKQALLSTLGRIISSHGAYKRSADAHFKAFVCAGLNQRKLVPWLKLILRNQTLLEEHYYPWSYALTEGFDDCFRTLERLSMFVFDIPEDIAIKQFQDLDEAF